MVKPKFRWNPVFSAHAEVVPLVIVNPASTVRILRARGGSSAAAKAAAKTP